MIVCIKGKENTPSNHKKFLKIKININQYSYLPPHIPPFAQSMGL